MAVPWPGKFKPDSPKLAYNYYHSSGRIRVECAFGMLSRKWLLLKRPWEGSLARTAHAPGIALTVLVCMRLHNLTVDTGDAQEYYLLPEDMLSHTVKDPTKSRKNHLNQTDRIHDAVTLLSSAGTSNTKWIDPAAKVVVDHGDGRGPEQIAAREAESGASWYGENDTRSQRDPAIFNPFSVCAGRDVDTSRLSKYGRVRPNKMWWKAYI